MAGIVLPSTIHDPTAGGVAPAAYGDALNAAIAYLAQDKAHCRVYNSADISIPNNTATALTFNSERVDVGGMHSTSSNTGRITVPTGEAGFYMVGGGVQIAANATNQRQLAIRLNGATVIVGIRPNAAAAGATLLAVSTVYQFAAGDYVELVVTQDSGGALNAQAGGNYTPEFWAIWLGI